MKFDKSGLLLVGAAAAVLLLVVNRSTMGAAGAPAASGQGAIGSNAASWLSNAINNLGGNPAATTSGNSGWTSMGGVTLFGNGTYDANGIYVDPGQLTYNTKTGQVQESPFSGMYNVLAPATYGY
ncbi:hypothetical protein [Paraburkholderia rhynchosiae]|uniref:Uncharacterized protein n=1 Tax=Paraburkholderia rhynchosiae TaxID=487049 RepID=A0A2N7VU36_9BURK|nr:hypothetical protein [Paraburkholderia rhynchosiae]PMS20662.1 hypothetical protein C0Z16_34325 [Paraburkholderia rhynchosiae]CAB3726231.1 hypothetical protein LMG27174_05392 [Paraburkholderia rhynchosiae]